ncbi:unnamed protein product [Effrenium voratum]|uniref:Uncharacterized protein n=1 Tax=Effrenium voratum TaxID=2562239 RepID=A0AA36NBP5_9DINO|nr:unnamed protein product [Effrenium voratum]
MPSSRPLLKSAGGGPIPPDSLAMNIRMSQLPSSLTLPFPQPRAQRGTEFALGRCSSKPLRRRAVARRRISRWRRGCIR